MELSFTKTLLGNNEKPALLSQVAEIIEVPQVVETIEEPFSRTPPYPIEELPGALPNTKISPAVNHVAVVEYCLQYLNNFNAEVFCQDGMLRDIYALTGLPRTFYGPVDIQLAWSELEQVHRPSNFSILEGTSKVVRLGPNHCWIQARISFTTSGEPATKCSGQVGIVPDVEFGWKIWSLTTILEEVEGLPNPDTVATKANEAEPQPKTAGADFDCVIVGAGFAGLCLAGRLKAMGMSYVIVEQNDNIGGGWDGFCALNSRTDWPDIVVPWICGSTSLWKSVLAGTDPTVGLQGGHIWS